MTAERGFDRVRVEVLLGLLREMTRRHVFDHALAQRADGIVGHGIAPVSRGFKNPVILRQDEPTCYPAIQHASRTLRRGRLPRAVSEASRIKSGTRPITSLGSVTNC